MKRAGKAITFVLALALVIGLMTVSAFATPHQYSTTWNLYTDYSKSNYNNLNGFYHAAVDSDFSSWGWTVGEVLSSDLVHEAKIYIKTMNYHEYSKSSTYINSYGRVSTGTQNTAIGEYAQKVEFTLNRTSAYNNIENAQVTVTHSN